MPGSLKSPLRIAGTKQVLKAVDRRALECVYIAADADAILREKLTNACREADVLIIEAKSMKILGEACGIDVGAACAGLLKKA